MIIKTISCRRTIQVRQFEPESAEMTADLEPGDDPVAAYSALRALVEEALGLIAAPALAEGVAEPEPAAPHPAPASSAPPAPSGGTEPRFMNGYVTDSQLQFLYKLLKKSHGDEVAARAALCARFNLRDVYALPKKAASDLINHLKDGGTLD